MNRRSIRRWVRLGLLALAGAAGAVGARAVMRARQDSGASHDENVSARETLLPTAGPLDTMRAVGSIVPPFAKGLIIRRPTMVALSQRLSLDQASVRSIQALRSTYGDGPLLFRNPLAPSRRMALVLSPRHVRRVLDETPDPFSTAAPEKVGALHHFQPEGSLISRGAERTERKRFNDDALDSDRHAHRLAEAFLPVVHDAARDVIEAGQERGALTWDDFFETWFRMVRQLVFGRAARDDVELIDMIERLRSRGNWSIFAPQDPRLRDRFLSRIREYLDMAEPESIASVISRMSETHDVAPEQQVPQWLFAFDPAGMATWRALALLHAHPESLERAREEARAGDRHRLPFLRASVLESLRLWPTAPLILRESTRDTHWENGRMPAGTTVVLHAPFFHRDDENLPYAHRFEPRVWLEEAAPSGVRPLDPMDWPLIPFSGGSGLCPGRHVVLLVTSNMLADLLDERRVRLKSPGRLDAHEPMPGTLDPYTLQFPLQY